MTARELKDILTNVPDDAVIKVSNHDWDTTEVTGYQYMNFDNILYIDIEGFKQIED